MKIWDKGYTIEEKITRFTVGDDLAYDQLLAKYDVLGSLAHMHMLHHTGLINTQEATDLENALHDILKDIEEGKFIIESDFEDIHSKVEYVLIQKAGEAGKKIHTARSRNDQVLVDLHLFIRDQLMEVGSLTMKLFNQLLHLSEMHQKQLMPGYTHLQIAMPSSFGLWFGAYAEALVDDMEMIQAARRISDQNPLGSAAGYGSSFPINRTKTTEELGFATMKYNVVAAQMSRGKLEKITAFALASLAGTLGKFAMDVCLYNSQNFGFVSFPDTLTTGSSIMPHKKNPDVFELVRGRCNMIQALPNEITLMTSNLPSGYHRDFQLLKEPLFPALQSLKDCLEIVEYMLHHIQVNEHILDDPKYDYLYTVENVNKEVMNGLSFREAYKKVGEEVQNGTYSPVKEVTHTHEGSIGNLCLDEIRGKMEKVGGRENENGNENELETE
jgi:argininosuccinate lyase